MADGYITIDIEVDGRQLQVASKDLDNLGKSGQSSGKGVKSAEDGVKGVGNESEKASMSIKKIATSLGLVAIGAAAFKILKSSMDEAISRFDTLERFPKVLQGLGVSAEDSERSMQKLSDGIDGLPTKLDDIANTAQRMYSSFGDMDVATDSALALNNALLGSGASAEQAKRGTEMYLKALQTGKMDMVTWRSLSETMDVGLVKIAEGFGFAGKSAKDDLYKALQSGSITMDEFNAKLIEVGTGTGVMAELAKKNSEGIATSLGNLRYAAARGIANVIEAFDRLSKEVTGNTIAQNIDAMKHVIMASFSVIVSAIEMTTPVFKGFATVVEGILPVVSALTPLIVGLAAAYASYTVITKATAMIEASNTALKAAMTVKTAATIATTSFTTAQVASTTATQADTIAKGLQAGTIKLSTVAIGVLTGTISASTAAQGLATAATYALGAAWRFLMGPIGWIIGAIGLLVAGITAMVSWFNRSTEEGERLAAQTEELSDSTDKLTDSVNSNVEAYAQERESMEASSQANADLAEQIDNLSEKENKSVAEKQMLNDYVNQLNESVEGLNLTYSDEADALNMSSEEMQARINLIDDQTSYNEALERQVEISKEQNEADAKLKETNELRDELTDKFMDNKITAKEYDDGIESLDEKEAELRETTKKLGEQKEETAEVIETSMQNITQATRDGVADQTLLFDDLSESQQETVESMRETWQDYHEAATDMFDSLNDEVTVTVDEMAENLEENTRIVGEWGEGIAELAERGVDEGLLETLREAGPESAGHVNALVNASDEELEELSVAFKDGGDVATEALGKSLGIEESGLMDDIGHLVEDVGSTLKEEVNASDFQAIGGDVTDGLAEGITDGTESAVGASKALAEDTTMSTKKAFQTQSPSVVYKGIGTDVTDGLAIGITQGTSTVMKAVQNMFNRVNTMSVSSFKNITNSYDSAVNHIQTVLSRLPEVTGQAMSNAMNRLETGARSQFQTMTRMSRDYDTAINRIDSSLKKLPKIVQRTMTSMAKRFRSGANTQVSIMTSLASRLVTPFNSTPNRFYSIGTQAMSGLNSGLNAGSGRVMATANNIANRVSATMKKALDIHSPSRLMRDDVGKMIPAGVALGIEDNAGSVYKALEKMSSGMMLTGTPEMALGTSRMSVAGGGSQVVDAIRNIKLQGDLNNKENHIPKQPAVINVHVGSKKVATEIVDDITNLQNRESNRKRKIPRPRGAF